jgi:hypothetical protein
MDQSEWEIILEQLLIMGLIVKEVVSENDDSCIFLFNGLLPSSDYV